MTYKELVRAVLEKSSNALTVSEIWKIACEFGFDKKLNSMGKTPIATIGAMIYVDIRNNEDSTFIQVAKRPTKFGLKHKKYEDNLFDYTLSEVEKDNKYSIKEKDLHPILVKFLYEDNNFSLYAKTINHQISKKEIKGKNEWLHPDIVAVKFPFGSFDENSLEFFKSINKLFYKIYSFELKIELSFSNLRECYFQALSNSNWANEAYLVVLDFDENDSELLDELYRLQNSFGVGLIKLDFNVLNSKVIIPAREKNEIDLKTCDLLASKNPDFRDFLQEVSKDIKINDIRRINLTAYDEVLNDEEYTEYIKKIRK
ncbi:HTH domain-containing protein [uncultured Campylobacter sp.]|uniref:HTH domain-containing protein n=1 Tax=uncultured Campylobacter sp. TaxID=218934 RepID=UPI002608CDAB|nr:HTH domain-containing protein [uncultured Campylobacter sp.]